jgi:hypothetical protein
MPVVIEGAKKHHDTPLKVVCDLEDSNTIGILHLPNNYRKSRLALFLRKDNDILWETLVLSSEMVFKGKCDCITDRYIFSSF